MKKLVYSLVVTFLMGVSVNALAQKSVAFFDPKTTKKSIDEKSSLVTFQLDNIANDAAKQKFHNAFKANSQIVREVNSTLLAGGKASYTLKMDNQRMVPALQNVLLSAGIESLNVAGQVVATKDLVTYMKERKAKKNSEKSK